MNVPVVAAALAAVCGTAAVAQTTWQLDGSAAAVRIVGSESTTLVGPSPLPVSLPAGDYAVHFGVDALGKPRSLSLAVEDGDRVMLAVAGAGVPNAIVVPIDAPEWNVVRGDDGGSAWTARCTGTALARDYRVDATFAMDAATSAGLVARWNGPDRHYRCMLDGKAGELRLERRLGPDRLVLARAALPRFGDVVELSMQVEGFRIAVCCDDRVVLQAFDGAFEVGSCGTWSPSTDSGNAVEWRRFAIAEPAPARASVALVAHSVGDSVGGGARFVASTMAAPGGFIAIELLLDRVQPPLPLTPGGLEPWLGLESATPRVLLADFRQSLGERVLAEVPVDGAIASTLRWPRRLAGGVVMVRALLISADGEAVLGTTPAAPLRL